MNNIILSGLFLGSIVFLFTFVASKRNGRYYMAPTITFLTSIAITAYGLLVIRGFEGMGYGMLGAGFLIVSIVGTLLLPLFIRNKDSQPFRKKDKAILVILPVIFFATIGLSIYYEQVYWIIDQGGHNYEEWQQKESYYEISTISEGSKQVTLVLDEEYAGKEIEVEKVSKRGPTEIMVNIVDGNNKNKTPYIKIGLYEIHEPLIVQTSDGIKFKSVNEEDK
ncbi:YesK family protein [Bacillus sp. PS06]|uniref:YesK family protein n=1 Tax=Bacillus sp. PS06 TaxID=2764176 RepID=UPI00177E63C8|nr:YesK family protein [Bacillus sp. PS06]MBD8069601.1 hypothetical protein [Bacillus sp. PS06]